MIIFDGIGFAKALEDKIKQSVDELKIKGLALPSINTFVFKEDTTGLTYTRLKAEASDRVGINYSKHEYAFVDDLNSIIDHINKLNQDASCTAILIQKPQRQLWAQLTGQPLPNFNLWWQKLVATIAMNKDVDGLHPSRLAQHYQPQPGVIQIWPATARAVWLILNSASDQLHRPLTSEKVAIVGVSELLGLPLQALLAQHNISSDLLTHQSFDSLVSSGQGLKSYSLIISATGQASLINGAIINSDSILIDVGEPKPDFDVQSVTTQAAFLTPVPGGVGPVTVACLLQNAVDLLTTKDQN